jgi:hypothetical protein
VLDQRAGEGDGERRDLHEAVWTGVPEADMDPRRALARRCWRKPASWIIPTGGPPAWRTDSEHI